MATAQTLIQAALREGNLIPVGSTPTDAENTEALARLNSFIAGLFGIELGEHLHDWQVPAPLRTAPVAANYPQLPYPITDLGDHVNTDLTSDQWPYPPPNSRLVVAIDDDTTVYLPEAPSPGARMALASAGMSATLTLNANGRLIEAAASVDVTSADAPRAWFYRDDTANWVRIADLSLSDSSPFPSEFDDLLICGLSMRLSPRYGQEPRSGTVQMYTYMKKLFKTRYKQAGTTVYKSGDIPRSDQSYAAGRWPWV